MAVVEEAFLYSVYPKKVIVGLSGCKTAIRNPKSLLLVKDDVYLCLKSASVYRRFAKEGKNEKVTIDNVDRLHRAEYISEEDWANFLVEEKSNGHATVNSNINSNESNSEVKEIVQDKIPEEVKKEETYKAPEDKKETSDFDEVISDDDEFIEKDTDENAE